MASEKPRREKITVERDGHSEDPKTAKGSVGAANRTEAKFESLADKVKEKDEASEQEKRGATGKEDNGENKQLSLEEISKLRQKAQQNSAEALSGARERYEKSKEKTSRGLGAAAEYAKEKGSQAKDSVAEGAQTTSQRVAEKGSQAKDTVLEGAQKTGQYVAEKGSQAKDTVVEGAQKSSQYIAEKGAKAKDTVLEGAQKTTQYAKEKAAAAKDATGKVALDVKDRATVTGWTAAHYATEKTVEGTEAAAKAVQGVTEKAAELASKPFSAVKQAAVTTGESMEEYTARKKEAAERGVEASKVAEGQEGFQAGESQVHWTGEEGGTEKEEHHQWQQQKGSSLLGAIGETIVEIAQTTKELLIGPSAQDSAGHEAGQIQYSKREQHKS